MKTLLAPASVNDLIGLLRAWRFWLLGALIGGLIGAAVYYVSPPEYRARASVVVSFNLEKSWPNKPDNELFYYLERESRKVEEIAWADATLQQVADQTNLPFTGLQPGSGRLELSQPQDGAWHFYAADPSAETASRLASAWAQAFTDQLRQGIQTAVALDAARKALEADPADPALLALVARLEANSMAITPELQVSLAQGVNPPVERKSSLGMYTLAGALISWVLAGLALLFLAPAQDIIRNPENSGIHKSE